MPVIMKSSDVRVQKTFRLKQETMDSIEKLREKEGLSQGKILDMAIQLLMKEKQKELV
ncbi:hypothetical protein JDS99_28440 [Bacillus cereus group sp. N6]|uniref:hypothetical protein n=1 Tax=Bacillus cereus group sp. N6 TaxID=2794583 RepID=UPI0018F57B06|nr:hypothetical protein [Bacillus cereus group sp. N6]MBJ8113482.1 hypothetical protein [Bacillus cereus group sp. N6]